MEFENLEEIPKGWKKETESLSNSEKSTHLSMHRTEMSVHRSTLSTARTYMANERTHLSYLRTSLALMSFGVTLNRFSIFLRESKTFAMKKRILLETEYTGLGMVVVGVIILIWAIRRYGKIVKDLDHDEYNPPHGAIKALTYFVLVLGGFTTIWMFLNRH